MGAGASTNGTATTAASTNGAATTAASTNGAATTAASVAAELRALADTIDRTPIAEHTDEQREHIALRLEALGKVPFVPAAAETSSASAFRAAPINISLSSAAPIQDVAKAELARLAAAAREAGSSSADEVGARAAAVAAAAQELRVLADAIESPKKRYGLHERTKLSDEAIENMIASLGATFDLFDGDGSGAIDADELNDLMGSLGLVVTDAQLKTILAEADEDGSGEIEFGEFLKAMCVQAEDASTKGAFASLITKKANAASLSWREDKVGPDVIVDKKLREASRSGEAGWSVQLLDPFLSSVKHDTTNVLLECTSLAGPLYFGLVNSNFSRQPWEGELNEAKTGGIALHSRTGECYRKGLHQPLCKLGEVKEGQRVHLEIDMKESMMRCSILKYIAPEWKVHASIAIDELPPECAVAVCFGPTEGGPLKASTVKLAGSSAETTARSVSKVDAMAASRVGIGGNGGEDPLIAAARGA